MPGADAPLPDDVIEAAIQVAGACFWYKNSLMAVLVRCGVPRTMWDRYATPEASKYIIARNIFSDLESKGVQGAEIQRKIVGAFIALRAFPKDVDQRAAREARDRLADLARSALLETAVETIQREARQLSNAEAQQHASQQRAGLEALAQRYGVLLASKNPQERGYQLEKLLEDLFRLHGIEYRHSFRTTTEQVDGAFRFRAFDYLVEAKWTQNETDVATLDSFRSRVSRRITSTRGCFISIAGFREEVVHAFQAGQTSNVILVSGEDLALILEDRFTLTDALELKTDKAAHEGTVFVRLADHMAV